MSAKEKDDKKKPAATKDTAKKDVPAKSPATADEVESRDQVAGSR